MTMRTSRLSPRNSHSSFASSNLMADIERERESVCVRVRARESVGLRERACVCVCVQERECICNCVRERVCECVCESVCVTERESVVVRV